MDAIQTPQLLELSGVGDPEVIQAQGIPLVHVLKGVGNNYIDHFATRMNWRVKNTTKLNEMSRGLSLASQVSRYYLQHKGILTLGTGLVHGFVKTSEQPQTPDVQYFFVHASYANMPHRFPHKKPRLTIGH